MIFGVLYVRFYRYVPLEGIRKGIVFGLLIWVLSHVRNGGIAAAHENPTWGVLFILAGIPIWVIYGLVLGTLYKK